MLEVLVKLGVSAVSMGIGWGWNEWIGFVPAVWHCLLLALSKRPPPTLTFLASDECVSHVQWKLYRLKDHMERCLSCSGGQIEGPLVTVFLQPR